MTYWDQIYTFLNVACLGTSLQWAGLVGPGRCSQPALAWQAFAKGWLRHCGPQDVLVSDGGAEFEAEFDRFAEQAGSYHFVVDAESPWQNGNVERAGKWL